MAVTTDDLVLEVATVKKPSIALEEGVSPKQSLDTLVLACHDVSGDMDVVQTTALACCRKRPAVVDQNHLP